MNIEILDATQLHQCLVCRHFAQSRRRVCAAFPDGIPGSIAWNDETTANLTPATTASASSRCRANAIPSTLLRRKRMACPKLDFRDPLARNSNSDRTTIDDELARVAPLFARPLFEPITSQLAHAAAEEHSTRLESEILDLLDRHGRQSL